MLPGSMDQQVLAGWPLVLTVTLPGSMDQQVFAGLPLVSANKELLLDWPLNQEVYLSLVDGDAIMMSLLNPTLSEQLATQNWAANLQLGMCKTNAYNIKII